MAHTSVLLQEIIAGLDIKPTDIYFDGTINGGGHSKAVADILSADGMIIGTDLDGKALEKASVRLEGSRAKIVLKQSSFRNLDKVLSEIDVPKVNKILLDLGLSSNQFDESGRGFSFQKDEPLLMTFRDNLRINPFTQPLIKNKVLTYKLILQLLLLNFMGIFYNTSI